MERSFLKAFIVYAYSFVLLFMFNGLLMNFMFKAGASPLVAKLVTYVISPVFLFFSYQFSLKRFAGFKDERLLAKAWAYHFVPFVVISFFLSWLIVFFFKGSPLGMFLFMNLEIAVIFFTFKLSYDRVLKR
ncbi:hypothetical protein SAMN06265339_1262 [Desulfurobacterium pacificum]|uniref:GtrA-like protein domain-containing protein n=1 Tax=Desulfurobacterium pacificum TaxID=240166 RepID=A0ABY1NNJ2_9BACT|nr:hypothetical protein [Desulfurobacterium pacificum]SMP14044.1 hypothetical protein SAMN06265339_1262 [Desulfurobacterium pacificum]